MAESTTAVARDSTAQARRPASRAIIALAFATIYLVWGSTYLAIRIAVETLPPLAMAGVRWLLAGVLLFAIVRPREKAPLTMQNWLATGLVGTLMLLGGNGLVCWAELTVASGLAALLIATVPIWMVVLDWLFFDGPRPVGPVVVGLVVGLVGICVLIGPERIGGQRANFAGTLALLAACVFWALGSLYSRRGPLPHSTWLATSMEMMIGGGVLLAVGAAAGEFGRFEPATMSLRSLLALAYLFVMGSVVALTAYKWLLQVCSPATVSTYAYVNPVIAILLGAALVGEPLTPRVVLAAVIILAAVVVITRFSHRC